MPEHTITDAVLVISPKTAGSQGAESSDSVPFLLDVLPSTEAPPRDSWIVDIRGDESVFTHLPWPTSGNEISVSAMQLYAHHSSEVTKIASVWEMLNRERQHNPREHGLVPILMETTRRRHYRTPTVDQWLLDQMNELVGVNSLCGNLAWFAPEADTEQFGTPYLTFDMGFRMFNESRWLLQRVGMEDSGQHQQTVAWNDTEGFTALAQKCYGDPEVYLVEAALVDSDAMPSLSLRHEKRIAVKEAREVFQPKKYQVRPILVKKILETASQDVLHPTQKFTGWASVEELTPWQYVDRDAERVYMCAALHVSKPYHRSNAEQVTDDEIRQAIQDTTARVQELLDERQLGHAGYYIHEDAACVIVARDLAKMWSYKAAVGIGAPTLMVPTEDGTGWQPLP